MFYLGGSNSSNDYSMIDFFFFVNKHLSRYISQYIPCSGLLPPPQQANLNDGQLWHANHIQHLFLALFVPLIDLCNLCEIKDAAIGHSLFFPDIQPNTFPTQNDRKIRFTKKIKGLKKKLQ